jgi:hypothetical protein
MASKLCSALAGHGKKGSTDGTLSVRPTHRNNRDRRMDDGMQRALATVRHFQAFGLCLRALPGHELISPSMS